MVVPTSTQSLAPCVVLYCPQRSPVAVLRTVAEASSALPGVKFIVKPSAVASVTLPSGTKLMGEPLIMRLLARIADEAKLCRLYGSCAADATEIDFLLDLAFSSLKNASGLDEVVSSLEHRLQLRTFLVGYDISIADIAVWTALRDNKRWPSMMKQSDTYPCVIRWFSHLEILPAFAAMKPTTKPKPKGKGKTKTTGTMIMLDDSWIGKVVTRFPPEPSGYLHIGHAKAAILNYDTATRYKGKMLLRFDDTNPSKEKEEFVNSIVEDLKVLGVKHTGKITHSSDYFDRFLELCTQMLQNGKAYVDKTPVEEMRRQRMEGIESEYRGQSIEENIRLWSEMQQGSEEGLQCVVRAKIDMSCNNKTMRDPALYRCNLTPHHRTGTQYKVYPTYDFCCPIIDSIEGVTHAMRTTEYHDRNEQYYWVIDALGLRKPIIIDFSRMNMAYTVLSKRKLNWLVDNNRVSGWDDPRFPTVRGMVRRGLSIQALTEFIVSQGASKIANLMNWDKLWNLNKKVLDPVAHRFTAVAKENMCEFVLSGVPADANALKTRLVPKDESKGFKDVEISSTILLEQDDARTLAENEEVTLMNWGNAIVERIEKAGDVATKVFGRLHLEGDFKKTEKKLTWVSKSSQPLTRASLVELDYLITAPKLEDGQFDSVLNENTWHETEAVCEASVRTVKKGQSIQFNRRGFFICEKQFVDENTPMQFIFIPDGHTSHSSTLSRKVDAKV